MSARECRTKWPGLWVKNLGPKNPFLWCPARSLLVWLEGMDIGLNGGRAERVDPKTGTREVAEFVGLRDRKLRFVHLPAGAARGTVVICSSVYAEFMKNYRREVRLARNLATAGFAAVRLQYRGSGNSEGDPATVTLSSLAEDISETVKELSGYPDSSAPIYVGTRIGAVVAALAAPPSAPLVLWEPVLNGDRWLKEGIRAATISSVSRQVEDGSSDSRTSIDRLEEDGVLDLLGFALYQKLVDDIRQIKLEDLLADRRGKMLIVQIGGGSEPKPVFVQFVERLHSKGADIELLSAGRDVAWWFEDGGVRDFATDDEVIAPTIDWLGQIAAAPR
jgi:pimeloyl-ACP methyl ester carboxylesterase